MALELAEATIANLAEGIVASPVDKHAVFRMLTQELHRATLPEWTPRTTHNLPTRHLAWLTARSSVPAMTRHLIVSQLRAEMQKAGGKRLRRLSGQ